MDTVNGPKKLCTLFNECVLRVPPYQRAYAWHPDPHLQSFLEDLRNHPIDQDKSYFYGTISRAKNVRRHHLTGYDLVDGQQRLTTACIFVAAALPRLSKDPELSRLAELHQETFIRDRLGSRKLETITTDDGFFEEFILQSEDRGSDHFQTPSQRRLFEAKQYFDKALSELCVDEIAGLIRVLYESQILVYAVDSDLEATQIFELQNDRGKPLTDLEALKSFLMYGLYLDAGPKIGTDLPIVQENFSVIYRAAEKMEGLYGARSEDELLTDHCIAFEERRTINGSDGWYQPKQLIRRILQDTLSVEKTAWIKRFSHRLRDSFEFALQIMEARDSEASIELGELTALGRTAPFWPLLLKCWKLDKKPGRSDFNRVVRTMESFVFRAILGGKRSDRGSSELRRWASDFSGDFEVLVAGLDEMRNAGGIIENFDSNLNSEHLFEWWGSTITYLLWRYENYLRTRQGLQMPRLSWKTIVSPERPAVKYERDHIEPKDPANPNLSRLVKWEVADDETRPFAEVCLHRLGNLVLDTFSAGSSKGSGDFASRIAHYTRSALLSQGEIVSVFATKGAEDILVWDVAAIRKRQEVLVAFAVKNL